GSFSFEKRNYTASGTQSQKSSDSPFGSASRSVLELTESAQNLRLHNGAEITGTFHRSEIRDERGDYVTVTKRTSESYRTTYDGSKWTISEASAPSSGVADFSPAPSRTPAPPNSE